MSDETERDEREEDAAEPAAPKARASPESELRRDDLRRARDSTTSTCATLLRGALRPPPGAVAPQLLTRRAEAPPRCARAGSSTATAGAPRTSPRSTYLVTSAIMLLLIAVVVFALLPYSSSSLP
jgi:hypothetical protein